MKDDFKFYVPAEIVKSADEEANGKMLLSGIASTSDKDRQGEELDPKGFEIDYLLKSGYINWHHQLAKNPEAIIGEPTDAKVTKKGLYLEAELYPDNDLAKKAYKLAQVLEKNSKTRRLGWSIEGKVIERDPINPSKVLKARITGVALTPMPINPKTFVNIMKAFNGDEEAIDLEKDDTKPNPDANGGKTYLIDLKLNNGAVIRVDREGNISGDFTKAMMATGNAGMPDGRNPLSKEDVEGKPKKYVTKADAYQAIYEKFPNLSPKEAVKMLIKLQQTETLKEKNFEE